MSNLDENKPIEEQPTEETVKAGKRHSSGDMQLLARLSELAASIQGIVKELGHCEEEPETDTESNPNGDIEPGSEVVSEKDAPEMTDTKSVSLDERVSMVRDAFWKQFRSGDYTDEYPHCLAIYEDYVVCKKGITHYKVTYTIAEGSIVFATKDQWVEVENEWIVKNIPGEMVEREVMCVKSLGDDRVGMHLVVWGNAEQRDLYKEYFTPKTEDLTTIFKAVGKVPLLYHHAMDDVVKTEVVGLIDTMQPDDVGLWVEAQLDKANKYKEGIKRLARQQALGSSSGTLPGARKVSKDGEILRWAIVEGSLTPTPAEPRQRTDLPVQVLKGYYEAAGLTLPETGASEPEGAEEAQKAARELELEREQLAFFQTAFELL